MMLIYHIPMYPGKCDTSVYSFLQNKYPTETGGSYSVYETIPGLKPSTKVAVVKPLVAAPKLVSYTGIDSTGTTCQ
jgi:hypothetical protein